MGRRAEYSSVERSVRKRCTALLIAGLCLTGVVSVAAAQDVRDLRIGTGGTGATYFSVGGLIASILSNPPGSPDCDEGGSCGVPGVIAAAVSTEGSVDNILLLADGDLDLGLSQADVAVDAYAGRGPFAAGEPLTNLRAIARLYPEALHFVVARGSDIASVPDLAGKRVSIGEPKSGTRVLTRMVFEAFGLSDDDIEPVSMKLGPAIDALAAGDLDALFIVGGYPIDAITQAAEAGLIDLRPVQGRPVDQLRKASAAIGADVISRGTYPGIDSKVTVNVGALLVALSELDPELAYAITRSLWHERHRVVLDEGDPNARHIKIHMALDGVPIPVHRGARRFYDEIGLKPRR